MVARGGKGGERRGRETRRKKRRKMRVGREQGRIAKWVKGKGRPVGKDRMREVLGKSEGKGGGKAEGVMWS